MNIPILTFEKVSYKYSDGTVALKDITLNIEKGKKIALLGNNGAGKSTLFLLFNGILKATNGQIKYKGNDLSYKRHELRQLRKQVGIVFQNPDAQLFSSSVHEDIKFGPNNLGLSREEVEQAVNQAMALTDTESLKDKPPHFLSIGQKKRVAIAGIVAMNPELMVLDEPTAGLDPYYARKIMDVLEDVRKKDQTVILSTHDVNLAFEWADEVILMNNGQIAAKGNPIDVFKNVDVITHCHLEQPWVMEVYEKFRQTTVSNHTTYPRTKNELFEIMF
ncbi:energy-coupling factor ABC transporter ATP-binding protein [Halalkalibacter nanhaiisediminis]|uniref:ABC transporter ATP-binding protein n=1 Tax=Halalkalibacter nanhaiisediminis TaxID=688079 RepID=A0A562QQM5_9BACI|nr:ATP-binding cassette domain-containing protein [Halalkalibacter nanhaiisediminis]TWI59005.1 cobalt/nickel transport system ATP-binding protein [Halalkalibacter nanhaiisediminis]